MLFKYGPCQFVTFCYHFKFCYFLLPIWILLPIITVYKYPPFPWTGLILHLTFDPSTSSKQIKDKNVVTLILLLFVTTFNFVTFCYHFQFCYFLLPNWILLPIITVYKYPPFPWTGLILHLTFDPSTSSKQINDKNFVTFCYHFQFC